MLTALTWPGYAAFVAANSATDLGRSNDSRRTSAPTMSGAFFMPAMRYGGCARDTSGCAGFLESRSANLRTVAPISCLAAAGDDSKTLGVRPMAAIRLLLIRKRSSRAAAHRAMAKAALFSNSSTSVRLRRYSHHMAKARHLEAQEVAQ